MSLKLGNTDVDGIMLGDKEVSVVYKGTDEVWSSYKPPEPIDDITEVFSTYQYAGTGGTRDIVNGIDLDGEGGLVWIKIRDGSSSHILQDSEATTANNSLSSDSSNAMRDSSGFHLKSFNDDGFTLESGATESNSTVFNYTSWTFRKAPNFFDVVTYTGDGAQNRKVPHRLGCQPGLIIVKSLGTRPWSVWHNSFPEYTGGTTEGVVSGGNATGHLVLNEADEYKNRGHFTYVNDTAFGVNYNRLDNNVAGEEYVAYLFAHDDSDESVMRCGSYMGDGSSSNEVEVGFEPQFILIKSSTVAENWLLFDTARGIVAGQKDPYLTADTNNPEAEYNHLGLSPTGFIIQNAGPQLNQANQEYIYMAIKAPPPPPPGLWATEALSGTRDCHYTFSGSEFPTDNFTVETWFKSFGGANHGSYASLFGAWNEPTNNGWMFGYNMSGQGGAADLGIMHRLYSDTNVYGNVPGDHYLTKWTHVSFTKSGGTIRIHLDGKNVYTFSASSYTWGGHSKFYGPGSGIRSPAFGTYSNFRVSDVARYNSGDFTPPTEPFVSDANTLILSHYGSEIKDYSDYSRNTSAGSGLKVTNDSPWTARDTYSKLANKQNAVREAASKIKDKRDDD